MRLVPPLAVLLVPDPAFRSQWGAVQGRDWIGLQQLEELRQLDRRELIYGFSHPITPIRVRALQLFRDAGGSSADARAVLVAPTPFVAGVFEVTNLDRWFEIVGSLDEAITRQ